MTSTIAAQWKHLARTSPDRVAVVDSSGAAWSFSRMWQRIESIGSLLLSEGLVAGDRVGILSAGFSRQYLEADHAIMAAGLVRVPIDPAAPRRDIVSQLEHAGARAILVEPDLAEKSVGLDIMMFDLGSDAFEARMKAFEHLMHPEVRGDRLASLNFTGGTTGAPKAVALTHRNLMSVVREVNAARPLQPDDSFLNVRPMWPISGIAVSIHLLAGSRVVLGDRFDAATFLDTVEEHSATMTSLVPTMLIRLLRETERSGDSSTSLRTVDIGAAAVPDGQIREAVSRFGPVFGAVYGLTEAPWTCYRPPEDLLTEHGSLVQSVGRPVGAHRVSINDDDGPVPLGDVGEIVIAGDHVMGGYWQNQLATDRVLGDYGFRTGDLGRFDERGRLHVVGRLKEIIRTGGRSVEPREVESIILGMTGVVEAAVIGLPDDEWGERVVAAVVRERPGPTAQEVIDACGELLAPHKRPRAVVFVESIPRSHYGKVLREELRSTLQQASADN